MWNMRDIFANTTGKPIMRARQRTDQSGTMANGTDRPRDRVYARVEERRLQAARTPGKLPREDLRH